MKRLLIPSEGNIGLLPDYQKFFIS